MPDRIATILLALTQSICGGHGTLLRQEQSGLIGPALGNFLVMALVGSVALACIVLAFRLAIHPGERNRDHPKYRILEADR